MGGRPPALSRFPPSAGAIPHRALVLLGVLASAGAGTSAFAAAASVAVPPDAAAVAPLPPLQEVEVLGEQPGPQLWKVTHGSHVLWLFGTLDHVPKRMTWRSREVESALSGSQALLTAGPSVSARFGPVLLLRLYLQWRGMQKDPDHTQLRDWLPVPLYGRFEALKARYDRGDARIEELRPSFAALRLYRRAVEAAGLTRGNEIEQAVIALAQHRDVPIEHARVRVPDPLGTLKQVRALSPALEVDCLATTVRRLETDLPVMQQRARAWAVGNVARLRALPFPDQLQACIAAFSAAPDVKALVASASQAWMEAAESALRSHQTSFALRPIYDLLATDGPLAHFRAEGYQVEGPD